MKKYETVKGELERLFTIDSDKAHDSAMEIVTKLVEDAYVQGVTDVQKNYTSSRDLPVWLKGFDSNLSSLLKWNSTAIDTIKSLYAKAVGAKP